MLKADLSLSNFIVLPPRTVLALSFVVVTSEGLFDPNVIRLAQEWEQNGIADLLGMNEDEVDRFIGDLETRMENGVARLNEELIADVRALLTGGFTLVGGIDSERTFESERFLTAIDTIDSFGKLDDGELVQDGFRRLVRGERADGR